VLACAGAELFVAPRVGGALAAWQWRGRDLLRPTEPGALDRGDVRALACYPLVPYSNRIAAATLHWNGVTHALARNFGDHPNSIHGLGWQRPWDVLEQHGDAIRLGLRHAADTAPARAAWPWPFTAEQRLRLCAADGALVLDAAMTIASTAGEPFPFGLGWHPFFPCDATTLLGFAARSVWRNDATQLPVESVPIPPAWQFDPPQRVDGVVLDQVFDGWPGSATLEQPAQGLHLRIDADAACGHLVVYAPAGRGFVAVEPVTHQTDAFNRAARGERDTGTRVLAPGQAFSCTMRITVHPLG
jgi:aldose 1-epimerase